MQMEMMGMIVPLVHCLQQQKVVEAVMSQSGPQPGDSVTDTTQGTNWTVVQSKLILGSVDYQVVLKPA